MTVRPHADTGTISLAAAAQMLGGEETNGQTLCPGPGHSPKDRSLSVKFVAKASEGFVVYSHANDKVGDCRDWVRQKLGLPTPKDSARPFTVETYPYENEFHKLQYQTVRQNFKYPDGSLEFDGDKPRKKFLARHPGKHGGWEYKINGLVSPIPYRLPELQKGIRNRKRIFLGPVLS
jgi:hypothetical protein